MNQAIQSAVLFLLRAYKLLLSPFLPPACRYVPTCSEYAAQAVELHGPWRGGLLAAGRLLRCHPFVKGGVDPVPLPHDSAHTNFMALGPTER
ncbi:MAG: membrane protein insertion efficiency factor YidD [Acidobacteria bacterium]|nr:membrane protein insertion efficiency factor YidD [Acidobacteriota bacterium]